MDKKLLTRLMQVKEYPCISIIFPTYRTKPQNQQNVIRLKKLTREAIDRLENDLGKKDSKELTEKIMFLSSQVDPTRTLDGLALFAAKDVAEIIDIPFHVRERVVIDKTFATRELIMGINRGTHYFILDISLHRARLISCYRDLAQEITDNGFPVNSDFLMMELNPSDFSREKEKQIKEFFNKVDKLFLSKYKTDQTRLVLTGVQKNLAMYREVADDKDIILAQIEGNYESESAHDLCKRAWEVVREKTRKMRHEALNEIQRAISQQRLASGIGEAWRFAEEGRVSLLVCEEDYSVPASFDERNTLILDVSGIPENKIIPDAVDEVAATVLEKGGKVVFVDNGLLGNYYKIAAILRY
jgi:hypothetical protein